MVDYQFEVAIGILRPSLLARVRSLLAGDGAGAASASADLPAPASLRELLQRRDDLVALHASLRCDGSGSAWSGVDGSALEAMRVGGEAFQRAVFSLHSRLFARGLASALTPTERRLVERAMATYAYDALVQARSMEYGVWSVACGV